jgi:hypothetical protein
MVCPDSVSQHADETAGTGSDNWAHARPNQSLREHAPAAMTLPKEAVCREAANDSAVGAAVPVRPVSAPSNLRGTTFIVRTGRGAGRKILGTEMESAVQRLYLGQSGGVANAPIVSRCTFAAAM